MKRIMLVMMILTAGGAAMVYGAFEDIGGSVRGRALANAIFADFDGVNTMVYNPANIAHIRSIQTYASWDTPNMVGFNDGSSINSFNFNFAIPFWNGFTIPPDTFFTKRAALGISVRRMGLGGMDSDGTELEFYHEGVYSLYYAKDLNDLLFKGAKISAGLKFSLYDIGVGNSVDVLNNANFTSLSRLSFGMDAGLTYDFSDAIHLGLIYRNLVPPNISIMPDGTDTLPSELAFGMNWEIGDLLFIFKKSKLGFGLVSYGRDATDNRAADAAWNLGYEFRQLTSSEVFKDQNYSNEIITVRLGASYMARKTGDQVDLGFMQLQGQFNVSGGIGLSYVFSKAHQVVLDYTIEYGLNNSALKQAVGLAYNFLFPASSFVYREEAVKLKQMDDLIKKPADKKPATRKTK